MLLESLFLASKLSVLQATFPSFLTICHKDKSQAQLIENEKSGA